LLFHIKLVKIFDTTLRLQGYDLRPADQDLLALDALNHADYTAVIERQKQTILDYHLAHTSFYKKWVGDTVPKRWEDLPVLTKGDLQRPLQERLSQGYTSKNCYVGKTSGSSGTPFIFAKDKACHARDWAAFAKAYAAQNIDINKDLQARFYGIPLDTKGYYTERLKDKLLNRYRFPIFNMNDAKMEAILNHFRRKPFAYINGYTSSIALFARYLAAKNIVLTSVCPTLTTCMVTSEMLFPEDKAVMEKCFGVPVLNEYGASELGLIAFSNTEGEMVLNTHNLYVECLDENNQPVPHGNEGKLVITALHNKAHPMIRFEIGDVGVISQSSTDNRKILKKLIGRTSDIATLPDGKVVPGLTFYYVTKRVIANDSTIKEFVITQTASDTFVIDYVSTQALSKKQEQDVITDINTYVATGLQVVFNKKDHITRQKSGKLKQFTSLVSRL